VATHFAKISIVRAEPGRYGFPDGAWEPNNAGIKRVCGAKESILYTKKFPPYFTSLKTHWYNMGSSVAEQPGATARRGTACRARAEISEM